MDKDTKELIEKILHEIAEDIISRFNKGELKNKIGLFSGKAGISLFMFYNGRYFENERYKEYAKHILEDVFNDINNDSLLPTYCNGLAGVGWAVNHLAENGFIEKESLEVLKDFDIYLYDSMIAYSRSGNFDFLHGATGIAFYFTQRFRENENIAGYLNEYIEELKKHTIFDDENNSAKIESTVLDENEKSKKVYNLSLSHGMSSIIIILCRIAGISQDYKINCLSLIEKFTNYIIENKNTTRDNKLSFFPSYIEIDGSVKKERSRLAWCYGDIGNGFAFLNACKLIKDKAVYKDNYIEIFDSLSVRTDAKDQLINDSGICHGSSGINVISNVLSNIFQIEKYESLVDHWQDVTLSYYSNKGNDLEGFSMRTKDGYEYELGILNGTAGVGLSFLSNLDKINLNWTDMLLIN
ncbi:MAG: lanthionine synthetase C family protein [Candidatus Delongbacteria bacterium]|nr:lanthionine synthetase C family protein [Candidatus Delongbacteria bacterium]MDD4205813.1 lanthionine synthetase C family protein [Candidatus Delongbacteria bacterium]